MKLTLTRSWKICFQSILLASGILWVEAGTAEATPDRHWKSSSADWTEAEQFQLDERNVLEDVHPGEDGPYSATTWNIATGSGTGSKAISQGGFSPSLFPFVTIVPDDGSGPAGGWQKTSTTLNFIDARQFPPAAWSCTVGVGMPIRAAAYGFISPSYAATLSAAIATEASSSVMHSAPSWVPALFCIRWRSEMQNIFTVRYPMLGARVTST